MRATTVMILAVGLLVVGHWAANKPTVSAKMVVEFTFAVLVIAMLDQGRTQEIARGFAWLFFAAVILGSSSPLNALNKAGNPPAKTPASRPNVQVV